MGCAANCLTFFLTRVCVCAGAHVVWGTEGNVGQSIFCSCWVGSRNRTRVIRLPASTCAHWATSPAHTWDLKIFLKFFLILIFIFGSISQWSRIHQYGLLSWPVSPRYPPFCVSSVLGLQAYHHSQLFMWMHKPDSGPPHRFVLLLFFSLWILNTMMEFIDGIYF